MQGVGAKRRMLGPQRQVGQICRSTLGWLTWAPLLRPPPLTGMPICRAPRLPGGRTDYVESNSSRGSSKQRQLVRNMADGSIDPARTCRRRAGQQVHAGGKADEVSSG